MRILEVCSSRSLGGLELYFKNTCLNLSARGFEVTGLVNKNTRLSHSLSLKIPLRFFGKSHLQSLYSAIVAGKPDIVHVHYKADLKYLSLLKWIFPNRFRYVHTRQMDFPGNKKDPYHWLIYSRLDLIITITDHLREQMVEKLWIDPNKVKRLYYGVPKSSVNHARYEELGLDKTKFNIALIGRIDSKKDQLTGIEAVKLLNNPSVMLYLVGDTTDPAYEEKVKRKIAEATAKNIIITGFIDNPQELMGYFDLILLTTPNETFGLVLPEAMRAGVAVIGADGGGVPEIIDHKINGLLFTPQDPETLKRAILEMMDEAKRSKYIEAGMKKADSLFDLDNHYRSLINLFTQITPTRE